MSVLDHSAQVLTDPRSIDLGFDTNINRTTIAWVIQSTSAVAIQVGRDVVYETTAIKPVWVAGDSGLPIIARYRHLYEISSVSVSQNNSASPTWDIEAMPKAVQQMKRDKKPGNISGSGYEYVKRAAKKYG
jgi:hypothetical protein